jgi:uncharacterized protein HemY
MQKLLDTSTTSSELQPQYLYQLGNLYLKNNQITQAKSKLQQVVSMYSSSNWAVLAKEVVNEIEKVQKGDER